MRVTDFIFKLRWSYTLNFRYLLFFKKYIKQVVTPIIISSACF